MKKIIIDIIAVLTVALIQLITCPPADAQGVGIGTNNPKATLHVAGTVRIDSARAVAVPKRIMVLDTSGEVKTLDMDTLKKMTATTTAFFYAEVEPMASTTSSSLFQPRVTLTLQTGTYIVWAYFEAFSPTINAGVRGVLYQGSTEIAYGELWSDMSTYSPWYAMKEVVLASSTTISLDWASWPNGTTAQIRRARITAVKIQ